MPLKKEEQWIPQWERETSHWKKEKKGNKKKKSEAHKRAYRKEYYQKNRKKILAYKQKNGRG